MDNRANPRSRATVARKNVKATRSQRTILRELAKELCGVIVNVLREFGVPGADIDHLILHSIGTSRATPISDNVLRRFTELGDLIAAWQRDAKYLDIEGKPRILSIEGRGATFAALARRYMPGMAVIDAVQLACSAAEIGTLRGRKIALYGSTLVNTAKNPQSALAQCICHIAWLSQTSVHNYKANQIEGARGRIERLIGRTILANDFEAFQRQIRPQIHDLCERVDGMLLPLEQRAMRQSKNQRAVRMGIYLYTDGGLAENRRTS